MVLLGYFISLGLTRCTACSSNSIKNHVVQVVAGVCMHTKHFLSVEICHLKRNVMAKHNVGVREIMAQRRTHTKPSCHVSLHRFLLLFFFFFVPLPLRTRSIPEIEQITFNFTNMLSEPLRFATDTGMCCTHSYSV